MYTFDTCQRAAQETYNIVCSAYDKLFSILGIDAMKGVCVCVCVCLCIRAGKKV